jgi:hypothetical protein
MLFALDYVQNDSCECCVCSRDWRCPIGIIVLYRCQSYLAFTETSDKQARVFIPMFFPFAYMQNVFFVHAMFAVETGDVLLIS